MNLEVKSRFVPIGKVSSSPTLWCPDWRTYWSLDQFPSIERSNAQLLYQAAFAEPPWNENWTKKRFERKLVHDLTVPAIPECADDHVFITVIEGDSQCPMAGFCYGAVIDVEMIEGRILATHRLESSGREYNLLREALSKIPGDRVVTDDEICVARPFRRNLLRLAQLCYPSCFVGAAQGLGAVTWSDAASRMTPILQAYGFEVIGQVGDASIMYSAPDAVAQTKDRLEEIFAETISI